MHNTPDILIQTDRSITPEYPPFVKRLFAPELEHTGPAEYNTTTDLVVKSLKTKPGFKILVASDVGTTLLQHHYLQACLGIHDGLAIQAKGIETFRALKASLNLQEIHLWRSIASEGAPVEPGILFGQPNSYLPILTEKDNSVVIEYKPFSDCRWFKMVDIVLFAALLP
jgi:hypothetical protein